MAGKTATLALKITGDAGGAARALTDTEDRAKRTGSALSKVGGALKGLALGAAGLAVGAAVGLGKLYQAADESRKITALTAAVIKSTGGAAKITAEQVGDLAGAIAAKTGVDDEAIQSGANLLLTFTKVRNEAGKGNDIFDQATQAAVDMSVAFGTDAKGAALQLGKALNDPVKGITALSKAGVSFTAEQKEQIKTLVKTGDVLGAQKIILGELSTQFGGAAEAAATPMAKLKQRLGDIAETAGAYLIPVVDRAATFLTDTLLPAFQRATDEGGWLRTSFETVSTFVRDTLIPELTKLWNEVIVPHIIPALKEVGRVIKEDVVPFLDKLYVFTRDNVVPVLRDSLKPAAEGIADAFDRIKESVSKLNEKLDGLEERTGPLGTVLRFLGEQVGKFIGDKFRAAGVIISTVIDKINQAIELAGKIPGAADRFVPDWLTPWGAANPAAGAAAGVFGAAAAPGVFAATSASGGAGSMSAASRRISSGDTYNITVNGALDPAAVADQIGRLLESRARRTGRALVTVR